VLKPNCSGLPDLMMQYTYLPRAALSDTEAAERRTSSRYDSGSARWAGTCVSPPPFRFRFGWLLPFGFGVRFGADLAVKGRDVLTPFDDLGM
jgi:hypothetical protein